MKLVCEECGEPMHAGTHRELWPNSSLDSEYDDMIETSETLLGYTSPEGHDHSPNCLCRTYICSNKHMKKVSKRRTCPSCDWKGKTECFCHKGSKVDEWPD